MRKRDRRPHDTEFVLAQEYEAEAPACFNLPEYAVLYVSLELAANAHAWIASDGVYLSLASNEHYVFELDEVAVLPTSLDAASWSIPLTVDESQQLASSLERCQQFFGQLDNDAVDLAEPLDYETGDADDLGPAELLTNYGEGLTSAEGPITAVKRRRSE